MRLFYGLISAPEHGESHQLLQPGPVAGLGWAEGRLWG